MKKAASTTSVTMKIFALLIAVALTIIFNGNVYAEAAEVSIGQQIADEASRDVYQGIPYSWGGADTSGFDCSGFVLYIYQKFGYDLPHYTGSQKDMGIAVDYSDLEPGDLVFFYYDYGHVGIYVGDGNVVHAGSNGITTSTIESGYYLENYKAARRIV